MIPQTAIPLPERTTEDDPFADEPEMPVRQSALKPGSQFSHDRETQGFSDEFLDWLCESTMGGTHL